MVVLVVAVLSVLVNDVIGQIVVGGVVVVAAVGIVVRSVVAILVLGGGDLRAVGEAAGCCVLCHTEYDVHFRAVAGYERTGEGRRSAVGRSVVDPGGIAGCGKFKTARQVVHHFDVLHGFASLVEHRDGKGHSLSV